MRRMLSIIFLFLSASLLFAQVNNSASEESNTNQVNGTENYSFEGESFVTIFSAWQDIKTHNLSLLQLVSVNDINTTIYPAGEVYELDKDRYSTGYIFVKRMQTPQGIKVFTIQFDMIINEGKITINYKIISNKNSDYGLSQEDLTKMQGRYQKHMESFRDNFIAYFTGMRRLAREYHGITIKD